MDRSIAEFARDTAATVYNPEGMEITVLHVHSHFPSVIAEKSSTEEREVYRLDELSESRELLLKLGRVNGPDLAWKA